jgi:uncharacterized spore protein YtfJ
MSMELERINQMVEQARDVVTVRRVFGEAVERDGTLVIPAASVVGGAGGGGGDDGKGAIGAGSGFGVRARPVGAFVIRDGNVRWEPVVDPERERLVNALLIGGALLVLRSMVRGHQKRLLVRSIMRARQARRH